MKTWIEKTIKRFILNTIIDDLQSNGPVSRVLKESRIKSASESLQGQRSAALFGKVASETYVPGKVKAGNAFKE